jgi:hypothetical protein
LLAISHEKKYRFSGESIINVIETVEEFEFFFYQVFPLKMYAKEKPKVSNTFVRKDMNILEDALFETFW